MATTNEDDFETLEEEDSAEAGETLRSAKPRGRGRPPKSLTGTKAAPAAKPIKTAKASKGLTAAKSKADSAKAASANSSESRKPLKKAEAPVQPTVPSRNAKTSGGSLPTVADSMAAAAKKPAPQTHKLPEAFLQQQKQKLLDLRDHMVSQMQGVARDTLRGSMDGSDSAFGMHQADAGSDSYDRDFALNLLSKEQDALYEIDEALLRLAKGTYGICEESGEIIPQARLEAMPFARLTVACQEKRDQEHSYIDRRQPVTSLFGLEDKDKTVSDED